MTTNCGAVALEACESVTDTANIARKSNTSARPTHRGLNLFSDMGLVRQPHLFRRNCFLSIRALARGECPRIAIFDPESPTRHQSALGREKTSAFRSLSSRAQRKDWHVVRPRAPELPPQGILQNFR